MALKESEAIVLRTYPLRESDLLVTLFTRLEGKVKGVARAAMKSRRRFGGALEPLTYVRAFYDDRERQELARLDSCEVIESPMATEVSYSRAAALAHVAELLDELMPDREASDAVFRLSLAVLQELRGQALWMPITYFELWMTRLMGFLPEFAECVVCGRALDGGRAHVRLRGAHRIARRLTHRAHPRSDRARSRRSRTWRSFSSCAPAAARSRR